MALRLLLGVSWICFLVFNGSDGSPAIKGYGYPHKSDMRNMAEEYTLTSPTSDESNFQDSNNQLTDPVYTSYNTPTVARQPTWTPYGQNLPNTQSNRQVDRLVNGVPRDWGQENLDEPIVFPLSSNLAKPQPGPVQPQSTSFSVSTNNMPNPLSTGASTQYASHAYHDPPSNFQARESPNLSLQPEPMDSGYGVVDYNAGSSAAGGSVPYLVYEDVFQYPETQSSDSISNTAGGYGQADVSRESSTGYSSTYDEPSFPSYPANVGPQYPAFLPWRRLATPGGIGGHSGQPAYQPHDEISQQPQKTFDTKKVEVNQRASEPIPPPSYIVQSRNSYARGRELSGKTKYNPESYPLPSLKGPAPSQPATPKNVKNPDGAKW